MLTSVNNNKRSGIPNIDLLVTIHEDIAQLKRSVHELQINYVDIKTAISQEVNSVLKEQLEELKETFAKEIKNSLQSLLQTNDAKRSQPQIEIAKEAEKRPRPLSQELPLPINSKAQIKKNNALPPQNAKVGNNNACFKEQPVLIKPTLVKPSQPQPVPILHLKHGKKFNPMEVQDSNTDSKKAKVIKVIFNTKTKDNLGKSEIVSIVEEKPEDYKSITVEPNNLAPTNSVKYLKQKSTNPKQKEFKKQTKPADQFLTNHVHSIAEPSIVFKKFDVESKTFQNCVQNKSSPLQIVQEKLPECTITAGVSHENSKQDNQITWVKKCPEFESVFNLNGHILSEVQNLTIPIPATEKELPPPDEIIAPFETIEEAQIQNLNNNSLKQVYQIPSSIIMCPQSKPLEIFNSSNCVQSGELEEVVDSSHKEQMLVNLIPTLNPINSDISYNIQLPLPQQNEHSAFPTILQDCRRDMDKILETCDFSQSDDESDDCLLNNGTSEDMYKAAIEPMRRISKCNGLIFNQVVGSPLLLEEDSMERLENEAEETLQAEAEVKKRIETLSQLDPLPTTLEPEPKLKEIVEEKLKSNPPQKINECPSRKYKKLIEGNHPCPFCPEKIFLSERSLQLHLRTHPGVKYSMKKAQICDICAKPFMCPSALKTHLRTHTGEKPFLCESCGRGFADIRNLKRHVISCSRPPKPPKPYVENLEAKLLMEKQKLPVEHPHVCNLCGKTFAHFTEYTSHMRIHTEITPYSCRLCGNFFQNPVTLQAHISEYHILEKTD